MISKKKVIDTPKIDLHRHLEGSVSAPTMTKLYRRHHSDESKSVAYFDEHLTLKGPTSSLDQFINKLATRFLKAYIRTPQDLCFIFQNAIAEAATDNISHLELRFTLSNFIDLDTYPHALIEKINKAIQISAQKYNLTAGLLISLKRDDPIEKSRTMVALVRDLYKEKLIVGADLAGNEHLFPNHLFVELLTPLANSGIPLTIHAGEVTNAESVRTAITQLHADRIGHGTKVAFDPKVMELLARKQILLEVCPTSNLQTGTYKSYRDIPIRTLIDNQVPILICSDDPITSGITLSHEVHNLIKLKIITFEEYQKMLTTARWHAFI